MKKTKLSKLISEEIQSVLTEKYEEMLGDISNLRKLVNFRIKPDQFGLWLIGSTKDKKWIFIMKVFEDPSHYGINSGRISKLNLKHKETGEEVYYDRGWNKEPRSPTAKKLTKAIVDSIK